MNSNFGSFIYDWVCFRIRLLHIRYINIIIWSLDGYIVHCLCSHCSRQQITCKFLHGSVTWSVHVARRRAPFIKLLLPIFLGEHHFVMKYEELKIYVKRDIQRKKSGLHVSWYLQSKAVESNIGVETLVNTKPSVAGCLNANYSIWIKPKPSYTYSSRMWAVRTLAGPVLFFLFKG